MKTVPLFSIILTICTLLLCRCTPLVKISPDSSLNSAKTIITSTSNLADTNTGKSQPVIQTIHTSSTVTVNPSASPTATITTTPLPPFPAEYYIENITGHKQFFPLGCETSAAVDLAFYYGVTINEYEFQTKLPQSDNPDFGFVGGVQGPWGQTPPYSYGVHAGPIADLLMNYGIPAVGLRDSSIEFIKQQLSRDNPIIVWVIGNMVGGIPDEYIDKQGNKVTVAAYEHVVILSGYDEHTFRYMNNGNFFEVPTEVFLNSWKTLGNMIVFVDNSSSPY